MSERPLWKNYLSAAVKTGGKLVPGVAQAIDVIETVENRREDESRHAHTLAELSRVEKSVVEVIEREMKAVLAKLHMPNITPRELEEEISNLYAMRGYGREPFLAQGLLTNSHWYDQLRTKPNLYGRVLQDHDKPSPECFYMFIDTEKTRMLEVSPFALQQLLSGQSQGAPSSKVIGQHDLFAERLPTPAVIKPAPAFVIDRPVMNVATPLPAWAPTPPVVSDRPATRVLTPMSPSTPTLRSPKLLAQPRLVRTLEGHNNYVTAALFSPDGKTVLTGSDDRTARLWTAATGKLLRTLDGHTYSVWAASFSPDGKTLLTGSFNNTARLWDADSGKLMLTLEGHAKSVRAASFSRDGKTVLTGSYDKTVRLWDAATGELLKMLEGHTDTVNAASFSPDGKTVLTGSVDKTARLWDGATGKLLHTLEGHASSLRAASFSPDGQTVLTGSFDNTARLWDAPTGNLLRTLEGHTDLVHAASISPDNKMVITGSRDETARLWDAATGEELVRISVERNVIAAVFAPDGQSFVLGTGMSNGRGVDTRFTGNAQIWQIAE